MILSGVWRRPVRLIEQLARPLPPLLAAMFEDSGTGALVLDRDRRIVRTNRCLDAMVAACNAAPAASARPDLGDPAPASRGAGPSAGRTVPAPDCTTAEAGGADLTAAKAEAGAILTACMAAPGAPVEALFAPADRQRVVTALTAGLCGDPAPPQQVRLSARNPAAAPVVALSIAPLHENNGEISGLLLRLTDVSAEKRLEAELLQLQKLQAVGQLAGGIAHDFNNLLTAIGAAADSVLEREGCPPATLDDVRQIRQSADRGATLVRQLLAFGRRQPLLPEEVAVNVAIRNLSDMLARLLGEQIRLQLDLEEPGRSVRVDPTQLDQVLVNLAVNARDAMPAGGTLTLGTGHLTLYRPRQAGSEIMPPGRYVAISVTDTGEGMAPAILPLVFEPFFTTRRERGGSGLGLSTVYGIVRQSGGFVTVESVVGQGTCVRFWLPRHGPAEAVSGVALTSVSEIVASRAVAPIVASRAGAPIVASRAGAPKVAAPDAGVQKAGIQKAGVQKAGARRAGVPKIGAREGETPKVEVPDMAAAPPEPTAPAARYILLVEDEESVRRLTERALQRAGWEVSAVDSAEAALERLPRPGDPIGPPCVMVSDIMLPGIDGTDLVRAARAIWPDLPAVLVSGYTDSALLGDLTAQGVAFLSKPFRLQELVACVERAAARGETVGTAT